MAVLTKCLWRGIIVFVVFSLPEQQRQPQKHRSEISVALKLELLKAPKGSNKCALQWLMLIKIRTDVKNNASIPCHITPPRKESETVRFYDILKKLGVTSLCTRQNSKQSWTTHAYKYISYEKMNSCVLLRKKSLIATYLPQQGQYQSERVLGTRFVSSGIIHGDTDL